MPRIAAVARIVVGLAIGAAVPGAGAAQPADGDATALVERIERHYAELPHFTADFEQKFTPRIFGRERVESGVLTIRRPGRMRFEYQDPEPKLFVTDGANTWFHVPADRQVLVGSWPRADSSEEDGATGANPLDILAGNAGILDRFDAAVVASPEETDGRRTLLLTPKGGAGELRTARLEVDGNTGRIHRIVAEDPEGNLTEFRFKRTRVGPEPDDALFSFRIPPGTDVVTGSGRSG